MRILRVTLHGRATLFHVIEGCKTYIEGSNFRLCFFLEMERLGQYFVLSTTGGVVDMLERPNL